MSDLHTRIKEWLEAPTARKCLIMPEHLDRETKEFIEYRKSEWYKLPKNKRPTFREFLETFIASTGDW